MITTHTMNIKKLTESFSEEKYKAQLEKVRAVKLFAEGRTDFSISIQDEDRKALSEDTDFLIEVLNKEAMSKIFFYESEKSSPHKIIIRTDKNLYGVENDGFLTDIKKDCIIISGLSAQGTANGIYRFCEDFLGCMFIRDDYDYIPELSALYLDEKRIISNPDFMWRHLYQYEVKQNNWYKKLQSNGSYDKLWGNCCHTLSDYVDLDTYFESNPEYFALYNGERTKDQLCLSNRDIYPVISKNAKKLINSNPDALYWDFSINDNLHGCQCENCRKMKEKYGGFGLILPILNMLAKEHPDKIISTLAYFFCEEPPRNIKAEKNINVKLAPISSGQMYSFISEGNEKAEKTKKLIETWGGILNNIYLWDYIVNFKHSLLPYPNFDVQRDNLKFYKEHNVTQVFHQGCRDKGAELACLRSYIMARQLWDTETDTDSLIAKYLCLSYGKAAIYIAEYLELQNKLLKEKGSDLDLYDNPRDHINDYLSEEAIKKYRELIDKAFIKEKDNPVIISRLEEIKINVLYAEINVTDKYSEIQKKHIDEIKYLIEKHGIDRYNEWNSPTLDDFYKQNEKALKFRDTAL